MIYHLEIEAKFCQVYGVLNGFPIYQLNGSNPAIFSKPINAALTKNNVLVLQIVPDEQNSSGSYSIEGKIKLYEKTQITGPDQGKIIKHFFLKDLPTLTVTFTNDIFDYSFLLKNNSPIDDKDELLGYAEQLRALLKNRNLNLILDEFMPKLKDFAIAYSVETAFLVQQFSEHLTMNYFLNAPLLDFPHRSIALRPWCDKRIWEIAADSEFTQLMKTSPNENGIEYVTKIFVARIGKTLKVVR